MTQVVRGGMFHVEHKKRKSENEKHKAEKEKKRKEIKKYYNPE